MNTKELSNKQKSIIGCISAFIAEHGFSPTVREIQSLLGYKSTSSVHFQLRKLADAGALSYEPTKPRTIVVLAAVR
ncbi:MAG: LexA repressor [Lachnospiraceae bacterium]|nr:LexA repressor [Lachnospiraceae bacterium]